MFIYLLIAVLGFVYIIRKLRYLSYQVIALLANLLGFLAFGWTFSGLFDINLLGRFLAVGFLVIFITLIVWGLLGVPTASFLQRVAIAFWNLCGIFWEFEQRHAAWSRIIRGISLISIVIYPVASAIFYFRIGLNSEQIMLEYLRINLLIIPAICLVVTLPTIVEAMLSVNADLDTLNTLLVFEFGNLGINALMISVVLWIIGFAHSGFSISMPFLGITTALFVFTSLLPYLVGWLHQKRLRELFLRKQQTWTKELVDILEISVPSLYVSKLMQLNAEMETGKSICRRTLVTKIKEIDERGDEINCYPSLFAEDNRNRAPCVNYLNFLDRLQESLGEIIPLFEGLSVEKEDKLEDKAYGYAQKYRARKDEIALAIETQKSSKPLLWIVLSFLLTPILSIIIETFSKALSESIVQLVPQLAHASSLAH